MLLLHACNSDLSASQGSAVNGLPRHGTLDSADSAVQSVTRQEAEPWLKRPGTGDVFAYGMEKAACRILSPGARGRDRKVQQD